MRRNISLLSVFCGLLACQQHPPQNQQKSSSASHQPSALAINQSDVSNIHIEGSYKNPEYGYTVNLPSGTVAITSAPPNPQHGFRIDLTPDQANFIWVDGSYNAAEYESAREALHITLEDAAGKKQFKPQSVQIGQLTGAEANVRYNDPNSKEPRMEDAVVAIRENHIVYTIGMRTSATRYQQDRLLLESLVKNFRLIDLPK